MENFGIVQYRPDGSYIIAQNGYPYHVPNEGEFADLWARVDAYVKANPDMLIPEPVPEPPPFNPGPDYEQQPDGSWIKIRYSKKEFMLWCGFEKIAALKAQGAKLAVVFGIGRACHIAFWEPHFAAEFDSVEEWKKQTHRIGAKLHPFTIEQNAVTGFKSRTTLVPCRANTIGPGLFLQADIIIGGCDGAHGRGMQWQGMSLWMTLRYGPNPWIPSTFMPTLNGKLFFLKDLAGPLSAECN
jgi:hypothetical protein